MTVDERLDSIEQKLDLIFSTTFIIPLFIGAPHTRDHKESWRKAIQELDNVRADYIKILKDENSNNSSRKSDGVS